VIGYDERAVPSSSRALPPTVHTTSFMRRKSTILATLTGLALATVLGGSAHAADESECPSGEGWIACKAQAGDPAAMYAVGRNAYEAGRTSGNFSEALDWARKLNATGDKNGERLLKMTYLQLGWGGHHDYVQAYVWLSEGIAGGADYLVRWRKTLAEKMTPEQLAAAKKLAGD
jgi:TPR repeat protein